MTKVIVVVKAGMIESVYTRNKNIEVEVLDLDLFDKLDKNKKRLADIENSKSYKDILK